MKLSQCILTAAGVAIAVQSVSSSAAALDISFCVAGTNVGTPTIVVKACFICDVLGK